MTRSLLIWSAALLLGGCSPLVVNQAPVYDVLIVGGVVVDGSGATPVSANLAVLNGRIASINADASAPARQVIDATGRVIVPGFIDPHTHAINDLLNLATSANANYLYQGVTTVVIGSDGDGVRERERSFTAMLAHGIGTNVAFFAGHGAARKAVMGMANRAPNGAELAAMKRYLDQEMRAGALGLSSGLYYAPGSFANTAEVIELAAVAARYGGLYDTHLRDEGATNIGVINALQEALEIGRKAAVPVHVSHIKALGPDAWGLSAQMIDIINAARATGLMVTANQYPWEASGTRFSNALIPRWVMADSKAARNQRLQDPALRDRITREMTVNLARRGGPGAMLVTGDSEFQGLTLQQIADKTAMDPLDVAKQIVIDGDPSIASFIMSPQDIHALAVQPWVITGSDGSNGHPRKYASYPKAYRDLVIDRKSHTLEAFVRRSSGHVADTLGLCNRGYLKTGFSADIAVIDLDDYVPAATYNQPTRLATGVDYVLVNGTLVIADGQDSGARPGSVIHRQQQECHYEF